jgi:thimet oligopeptidase
MPPVMKALPAFRLVSLAFTATVLFACQSNRSEPVASLPVGSEALIVQDDPYADSPVAGALRRADDALDAIVAIPDGERTYANTLGALDDTVAAMFRDARMPGFMSDVSTDAAEREAGLQAKSDMSNWFTRYVKREDLYAAIKAYAQMGEELSADRATFLEDTLREFRREGMDLGADDRARLLAIDEELNELGLEFSSNIADDETVVPLTEAELAGVPESFLASLPHTSGLVVVEMTGSNLGRILGTCDNESTRAKIVLGYGRRAGARNVRVIEKMIALRAEKGRVLGYPTFADSVIEDRMAKSANRVREFYAELRPRLRQQSLADFAEFEAAKREHTGDPEAILNSWDVSYYRSYLMRTKYAVDQEKVREYFSMSNVQDGLFDVYQSLFGLRFEEITEKARSMGRPVWHEDVALYEVWDAKTNEMLGEFYLDLHPRAGKYSHAAQFPLRLRKRWSEDQLDTPLVALVCNFTKPTADRPALLSHSEVETFFHEFGHCLHTILSRVDIASLAGTSVARDFVEAPSQMLENWIWNPSVLAGFAKHYETGEPIPEELVTGMIAAQNLGSGLSAEGQVYLGMMDLAFHSDPTGEVDTSAVAEAVYREVRLFEPMQHVYRQAAFGHLNGYQAGYYGYLWSLVYAQDMFSRFHAEGLMSADVATEYRDEVLSRGGTRDELDMVRAFLGREPNSEAFLRHLGLEID